jgi:hypothetical protein
LIGEVGIDGGGSDAFMSKQALNVADIGAAFEQNTGFVPPKYGGFFNLKMGWKCCLTSSCQY